MSDTLDLTLLETLAQIREDIDELARIANHQVSRGGDPKLVAADTRTVHLLEDNRWRHMALIYNDSTSAMYLSLGPNASPAVWTVKLQPNDYYETPAGYYGPITAAWDTATGQARVTELI